MKLDVFGKIMVVERAGGQWQLYTLANSGMRSPVYDVVIPAELNESEVIGFVADIFHEGASEKHPKVKVI